MFISENKTDNPYGIFALRYLGVSIFCVVFYLVYNRFSHGVHSAYMTYLFAWPLILGCFPCVLCLLFHISERAEQYAENLYHSGAAAVTVSSLLRGIFEIAGTASVYQEWLMRAGVIMLTAGAAAGILSAWNKSAG